VRRDWVGRTTSVKVRTNVKTNPIDC
jgi:hypothetical protein